jgi:hypothetical protein
MSQEGGGNLPRIPGSNRACRDFLVLTVIAPIIGSRMAAPPFSRGYWHHRFWTELYPALPDNTELVGATKLITAPADRVPRWNSVRAFRIQNSSSLQELRFLAGGDSLPNT